MIERRCLNCKRELISSNSSPFCSSTCMNIWDTGGAEQWRKAERDKKKNVLLEFSNVIKDYEGR